MKRLWHIVLFFLVCMYSANANTKVKPPIVFPKAEVLNQYTTRIPFELVDYLIVVEAELKDNKGNFIIDTGSETLIFNSVHFDNFYAFHKKQTNTSGVNAVLDDSFEKQIDEFNLNGFKLHNKVYQTSLIYHT